MKITEIMRRKLGNSHVVRFIALVTLSCVPVYAGFAWLMDLRSIVLSGSNSKMIISAALCAFSICIIYLTLELIFSFCEPRRIEIESDVTKRFLTESARSGTIKIFASGAENSKNLLLKLLNSNNAKSSRLLVQVLIRIDATPDRIIAIENQVKKWKQDIDEASMGTSFPITTELRGYGGTISLYGYIFDNKSALLSWYSRGCGNFRTKSTIPHFFIKNSDRSGKSLIEEAVKTFDCHFLEGARL